MTEDVPVIPATVQDEGRHEPTDELLWSESYYLDFVDPKAGVAGYVRIGILPNLGRVWYWACLVGPNRPLVTVIDHDVPLPPAGRHEVRSEGLWADYTVEGPLDHVSVGLEAFAVSVDDPALTYGDLRGDRVPFGMDLEWETDGGTYCYPGVDRYEVPCRVHGEVLVGEEVIQIDGWGQRDHSWGSRDWWSIAWSWTAARLDDGTRLHGTGVELDGVPVYGTGYVQNRVGDRPVPMIGTDIALHQEELGDHGLPKSCQFTLADLEMEITPVAFAPVLLEAPDGRVSRFPRAWTTFRLADGRSGHGWTEWNQPQP